MPYVRTTEIRNRISQTLKDKGIIPPDQTGFRHSEETKKKISNAVSGEKSYRWKGGRFKPCPGCDKPINKYVTKQCRDCYRKDYKPNMKALEKAWASRRKNAKNLPSKRYWQARKASRYPGHIDADIIESVYVKNIDKYGLLSCEYCGRDISDGNDTLDHKTSKRMGGTNNIKNLVVCCMPCNQRKHERTVEEFIKREQSDGNISI